MAETALTSSAVASSDDIVAAHPNTIRADLINHTHGGSVTPIIAADTIKTLTGARTLTLPTGQDDTVVTLGAAQTLTAKTLTNPTINAGSGTIILPQGAALAPTAEGSIGWDTDDDVLIIGGGAGNRTMVSTDGTQTLTGKTLTAPTIADFTNANHDHGDADDGGALVSGITLTAPTIADFTNANHDHGDADDGGALVSGITLTSPIINTPSASGQVYSGTYTPTLTGVTNVQGSTTDTCQYCRIGSVVTVSGHINIDPTATGFTELGISLPVASNFAAIGQCAGLIIVGGVTPSDAPGVIFASIASDRAEVEITVNSALNLDYYFHFTYLIV